MHAAWVSSNLICRCLFISFKFILYYNRISIHIIILHIVSIQQAFQIPRQFRLRHTGADLAERLGCFA